MITLSVYGFINTIIIQKVLSKPEWQNMLVSEDKRALNVLFHSHINLYGLFPLDLMKCLEITADVLELVNEIGDQAALINEMYEESA